MSGASGRRGVSVRIAGHDYRIRSDGDEEGLVRIAGYVDRAMERVRERTGTVDSLDVAVLTCLNLAREILAVREQRSDDLDGDRLRGLIERVESMIARPDAVHSAGVVDGRAAAGEAGDERPRTIELPSVESLRERMPAHASSDDRSDRDASPQPRVAAGGRDRVG